MEEDLVVGPIVKGPGQDESRSAGSLVIAEASTLPRLYRDAKSASALMTVGDSRRNSVLWRVS